MGRVHLQAIGNQIEKIRIRKKEFPLSTKKPGSLILGALGITGKVSLYGWTRHTKADDTNHIGSALGTSVVVLHLAWRWDCFEGQSDLYIWYFAAW